MLKVHLERSVTINVNYAGMEGDFTVHYIAPYGLWRDFAISITEHYKNKQDELAYATLEKLLSLIITKIAGLNIVGIEQPFVANTSRIYGGVEYVGLDPECISALIKTGLLELIYLEISKQLMPEADTEKK